ncbi:MAG: non-heme iron oxygenase ferredoxin subunit [Magnetococcales bacterium]|nr:non-heme iron oxygenase ferredoxin subunit [Magnetococcales bacterium]
MNEWVDVFSAADFPPGTWQTVDVDGLVTIVVNVDGNFYGLEDCCTHDGGYLSSGEVEGDEIICPRHGARFDIKTGAVLAPPAYEDINAVPVRVHQGVVQVKR